MLIYKYVNFLKSQCGFKRFLLAFLFGLFSSFSLPPFNILPFVLIGFCNLVWLLMGCKKPTTSFFIGWFFGFGFLIVNLHWMAYPMLVDPKKTVWLIPLSVILLPSLLSILTGLSTLVSSYFSRGNIDLVFSLPIFWVIFEWIRGNIFTGFPWSLVGYTLSNLESIAQIASLVGVYGLSFFVILLGSSISLLGSENKKKLIIPVIALSLFFFTHLYGEKKLNNSISEYVNINLRLVQANISQRDKWKNDLKSKNFMKHVYLSLSEGHKDVDIFIWSETAITYTNLEEKLVKDGVQSIIQEKAFLISGMPRFEYSNSKKFKLYNSIVVIDKNAKIVESYNKFHLVPFGEYLPLRNFLNIFGLSKIVFGAIDYSRGQGLKTIKTLNFPSFSPLICFEAIFPGKVAKKNDRPDWLLILSNDAWFGPYAGPEQHFEMSKMRAIEEGLPIVRVSNTGISAVIDSNGRVIKSIPSGVAGILDQLLPIKSKPTIYSRYGNIIILSIGLVILSLIFLFQLIKYKKYNSKE